MGVSGIGGVSVYTNLMPITHVQNAVTASVQLRALACDVPIAANNSKASEYTVDPDVAVSETLYDNDGKDAPGQKGNHIYVVA
jgi:hypothetical protein